MNLAQYILVLALRVYRAAISPILVGLFGSLGLGCRFHPTCSQYALEAVQRHGTVKGSILTLRRLCRCHPWGGCGDDPVPLIGHWSSRTIGLPRVSNSPAPHSRPNCPSHGS